MNAVEYRNFIEALSRMLQASDKARPDNLDAYRRFEQVFPQAGAEINAALSRDPIAAASGLLDVYEQYLHDLDYYPVQAVATVRSFLSSNAVTVS